MARSAYREAKYVHEADDIQLTRDAAMRHVWERIPKISQKRLEEILQSASALDKPYPFARPRWRANGDDDAVTFVKYDRAALNRAIRQYRIDQARIRDEQRAIERQARFAAHARWKSGRYAVQYS